MIAEIHGKISSIGSNLNERLEDQLTGNFFGNIRYLDYSATLKNILKKADFSFYDSRIMNQYYTDIETAPNNEDYIHFWKRKNEAEIDLLIDLPKCLIGIEVKYTSGLSSDDDNNEYINHENSINQLIRESRDMDLYSAKKNKYLIFLTNNINSKDVIKKLIRTKKNHPNVPLGFLTWTTITEQVVKLNSYKPNLILKDLLQLFDRKHFMPVKAFNNIKLSKLDFRFEEVHMEFKYKLDLIDCFYISDLFIWKTKLISWKIFN